MNNSNNKKVCIISYSNIAQDARVLRQIEYLSKYYNVSIIGYGDFPKIFSNKPNIKFQRIQRGNKTLFRRFYDLMRIIRYFLGLVDRPNVLKYAIKDKSDLYLVNNWDSLPIAAIAAKKNDAKLILDVHESLQTASGWIYNFLNKKIIKEYSDQIDFSTTVVGVIAEDYLKRFGFRPIVVRNIPDFQVDEIRFNLTNKNKVRLISHGVATPERRNEIMIETIAQCDDRYELHLVFINYESEYVKQLRTIANQIANGKVFFHLPYSPHEIVKKIREYDVGFYPLYPSNYNNLIALPNKFFDFIAAGLAVCIGPSLSMVEIINQYNNGVVAKSFDPKDIANCLNSISSEEWDNKKKASITAAKDLNAEIEMQKLTKAVHNLILS